LPSARSAAAPKPDPVGPADQVRAVHLGDLLDHAVAGHAEIHGLAGSVAEPVQERPGHGDQASLGAAAQAYRTNISPGWNPP